MKDPDRHDELYRRRILEHSSAPHNWAPPDLPLAHADLTFRELNPLCGDDLGVGLALDADGAVAEVRFEGHGCAVCMAAASLASDHLVGKTPEQIGALERSFVLDLLGIEIPPMRMRCALLPLKVLKSAALGRPVDWEPAP